MNLRVRRLPGLNREVGIFLLYSAIFHIGYMGMTNVLLNFYFVGLGHGNETVGVLQSLPRLGGFITGIPISLIARRVGSRRMLVLSTLGVAGSTMLMVLFPSLIMLALGHFLVGFFYGAAQIVTTPYMITLTPRDEHTFQFSYNNVVSMGTVALGSMIGGFMPLWSSRVFGVDAPLGISPEHTPAAYGISLMISAVVVGISVLPLFRLPDATLETMQRVSQSIQRKDWLRILRFSIPLFLFGISGGLTFPFYNLFFREHYSLDDGTVGTILSIGWLGMALIPMLNPLWEKIMGRVYALGILMVVSALAFLGLAWSDALLVAIPFYVIAASVRNTMQPLFQPLLMDTLTPELHNLASGLGMVLWNVGWFAATMSFGFLQTNLGYPAIMRLVAFWVAVNGIAVVWVFRSKQSV